MTNVKTRLKWFQRVSAVLIACALIGWTVNGCSGPGGGGGGGGDAGNGDGGGAGNGGGDGNNDGDGAGGGGNANDNANGGTGGDAQEIQWSASLEPAGVGFLSAVWGPSGDDVFAVGGTSTRGEIYRYNGTFWSQMRVPPVDLLIWVFGFGDDDVYAVGESGDVVHFDGSNWETLESGTDEPLWGVWGASPTDMWIVGGDSGDEIEPVLIHFDGETFESVPVPDNDRDASALFKVWGIGSKLFAVGERGLIIEFDAESETWSPVPTGASDDFVSLWGTSEDNIVAVGGRGAAQIATYDGSAWTTTTPTATPGLNGVFMVQPDQAIVGGTNGFLGGFNPATGELTSELSGTSQCIHAIWADDAGEQFFAVGGTLVNPFSGLAIVRTLGMPTFDSLPPQMPTVICTADEDCFSDEFCNEASECERRPACESADDCADDEACEAGVCVPGPQCEADEDCPEGQICNDGACEISPGAVCEFQSECALGENCRNGTCAAAEGADLILINEFTGSAVLELDEHEACRGVQGGMHTFLNIRVVGFEPDALVTMRRSVIRDDGRVLAGESVIDNVQLSDNGEGVNELIRYFTFFGGETGGDPAAMPGDADGHTATIFIELIDPNDETISATLEQEVTLVESSC